MSMQKNISIIQNFVCTLDSRKQMITENLPRMAEVFKDVDFYVNYNTSKNLEYIKKLYEDNVENLYFKHSTSRDWGLDTIKLLEKVTTPYVAYLCEDFEYHSGREDWEELVSEALIDAKVDFVMLAKIEKYSNTLNWPSLYKKRGQSCIFYNSKSSPSKVMSIDAIYKKEFLLERLIEYTNLYSYHLPNNYETYYKNDNSLRRFDVECAVPSKVLLYHHPRTVDGNEAKDEDLCSTRPLGRKND